MLLKNAPGAVDDAPLDKSKKKKGPAEDVRAHGARSVHESLLLTYL